ncbi:hypothetical protein GCM10009007_09590 [Formosimonas limnophila]|uniref:Uncharacterized protein n=1 Tax=Formosimonas limnophila TaxID=1384487 RepID=A0A8J3CN57_9BURK|nr:hypothetical protein GCM10009007_09590 [Formosimonas limnophila]
MTEASMWPGQTASAFEALAKTGGSPAAKKTGNVKNVPPPATALQTPAMKPVSMSKSSVAVSGMMRSKK